MLKVCIIKRFKRAYLSLGAFVLALTFMLSKNNILEASIVFAKKISNDDQIFFKQTSLLDSGLVALFIVFAIVWAGFFLYVFYMSRKSQNLMREIEILKSKIKDTNSDN